MSALDGLDIGGRDPAPPPPAAQLVLERAEGQEHLVVGVLRPDLPFARHDADDAVGRRVDADALVQGRLVLEEVRSDFRAQDADRGTGADVARREEPAIGDGEVADVGIVRPDPDDVGIGVGPAALDLRLRDVLAGHGGDGGAFLEDGIQVVERDVAERSGPAEDAAGLGLARLDDQNIRAERLNLAQRLLARPLPHRDHGDDRADPDDDAEHGQHRPHLVGGQPLQGDADALAEVQRGRPVLLEPMRHGRTASPSGASVGCARFRLFRPGCLKKCTHQ